MTITRRDLDRLNGILAEAARREIMPRFRKLAAGEVREKAAPGDLVTEADEAAERFIFAELERAFPGALLVGEEAATRDPAVLARYQGRFPALPLFEIERNFGGWAKAQRLFFADGGVFDRIYAGEQ